MTVAELCSGLTKAERNRYYREAFSQFRTHMVGPFLCNVICAIVADDHGYDVFTDFAYYNSSDVIRSYFPELAPHLPKNFEGWPENKYGNDKREYALTLAIENSNHI